MVTLYYPWQRAASAGTPWDRSFEYEAMQLELELLKTTSFWFDRFRKAAGGVYDVDPIALYVVPATAPAWLRSDAELTDRRVVGLSLHYNWDAAPVVAVFPRDKVPQAHQRIRIESGRRSFRCIDRRAEAIPVLEVGDWTPLPAESVYLDLEMQPPELRGFYGQFLNVDDLIVDDLLTPAVSAPHASGGGITIASLDGGTRSTAAKELLHALEYATPPEWRQSKPIKRLWQGKNVPRDHVKFRYAERPPKSIHAVAAMHVADMTDAMRRTRTARSQRGEASLYSTIRMRSGDPTTQLKDYLLNFTRTELALPVEVDDLVRDGADLEPFVHEIDDRLWLAHARAREILPVFEDESAPQVIGLVKDAMDGALDGVIIDEMERRRFVRHLMQNVPESLQRNALSQARADGRQRAGKADLAAAYRIAKGNFEGFLEGGRIQAIKLDVAADQLSAMPASRSSKEEVQKRRFDSVRVVVLAEPGMQFSDLWDSEAATHFESPGSLQSFLDDLRQHGYVYITTEGRYYWV